MLKSVAALLPEALVLAQEELVQTGKVLLRNAPIKEAADVARVSATFLGGQAGPIHGALRSRGHDEK